MPQISKIRIVNFNYNDGSRFIPDELYDLASPDSGEALNTLFNLNNGGGKTVLVQLMMQPVHPKAMAGGRHIEDYFSHTGDHSYILLEWNLDGSKEKLLTGISIAASSSASTEEDKRGNSVKYYTFTTHYDTYSAYSISSLDLSSNDNGNYVPARFDYVREKAKSSRGLLTYYSSDDAVKWAEFLAEYGIFRTEWESVIEVLNKDEGGLNQYFDEAKTSDKLIAKFFIPAIEQKLMSAASKGTDCSLDTILIYYAKKIKDKESVIKQRDTNKKLLEDLEGVSKISDDLYNANDAFVANVSETRGFAAALSSRMNSVDEEIGRVTQKIEGQNALITRIDYEKKSKDYYVASSNRDGAKADMEEALAFLEQSKAAFEAKRHEEDVLQSAKLYRQIQEIESRISELKKLIEDKENHSKDAERIAKLKYSVMVKTREAESKQESRRAELEEKINLESATLKECEAAKDKAEASRDSANKRYIEAEAALNASKNSTDKRVANLQIDVIRRFTGFYAEEELEAAKIQREKSKIEQGKRLADMAGYLEEIKKRENQIPQEIADLTIDTNNVSRSLEDAESELGEYDSIFEQIVRICEKYSHERTAAFTSVLRDEIRRDIETTEADKATKKRKLESLREKRKAAESGYLHILPEIMDYVNSTGLNPTTGEEYLCGQIEAGTVSADRAEDILSAYPEMAYALLFNNEKDIKRLLSAGNIEWLPAVVPLFTMEQIDHIFDGTKEAGAFLTSYDKSFFADREGYFDRLSEEISNLEDRLVQLQNHLQECREDRDIADRFAYSEDWRKKQETQIEAYKDKIREFETKKKELESELQRLQEEANKLTEQQKECIGSIQNIDKWLDLFDELCEMISDEQEKYKVEQDLYMVKSAAESDYESAYDAMEKHNNELNSLREKKGNIDVLLSDIHAILENVDNAKNAEVLEGDYSTLFTQYKALLSNMDESLAGLRSTLESEQNSKQKYEEELAGFSCEKSEYTDPTISVETLSRVRQERKTCEKTRDSRQEEYTEKKGNLAAAEQAVTHAQGALFDYEGIPLPQEEIGEAFKERLSKAREEIRILKDRLNALENEKRSLDKISYQVNSELEGYSEGVIAEGTILSANPDEQWKTLKVSLAFSKTEYTRKREELYRKIQTTVTTYKDIALAEIVGKLNAIGGMIDATEIKGDRLFTISESISAMIESIRKINSKIETDLREITNDFNDLVEQCFLQGKRVYEDLRMIASSSKAHIYEGKPQIPMLKMDLPEDKELSEEASRVSIRNEIEKGAKEIKEMLVNNLEEKQILKRAKSIVGSERLLHKYIIRETVPVKVYKIDLNVANSSYKRWEDTLTQSSGAEKFVVFFSVVLTLMNYTRSTSGIVSKEAKSVLILDNPFGKITSAHLLKPMFDIAKHFNVQLICLSDINKSDVTSCFECVIKLVIKQQALSNFEIMTHEGNERIEHGYYKIMNGQMSLF